MPPIEVKFNSETRTSQAGREYNIIEMFITNREGGWDERPNMTIMPFHARLLLQKLPEFCEVIRQAEGDRGEPLTTGGGGGGGNNPPGTDPSGGGQTPPAENLGPTPGGGEADPDDVPF